VYQPVEHQHWAAQRLGPRLRQLNSHTVASCHALHVNSLIQCGLCATASKAAKALVKGKRQQRQWRALLASPWHCVVAPVSGWRRPESGPCTTPGTITTSPLAPSCWSQPPHGPCNCPCTNQSNTTHPNNRHYVGKPQQHPKINISHAPPASWHSGSPAHPTGDEIGQTRRWWRSLMHMLYTHGGSLSRKARRTQCGRQNVGGTWATDYEVAKLVGLWRPLRGPNPTCSHRQKAADDRALFTPQVIKKNGVSW